MCPSNHTGKLCRQKLFRKWRKVNARFEPTLSHLIVIWSGPATGLKYLAKSYDIIYVPYDNPCDNTLIEGFILFQNSVT